MSTNTNFGPSFKTGIKNGKSPVACVNAIANRTGKTPSFVWNNLKTNGYAWCTKFNGQNFWFPTFKPTGKGGTFCETQCWENLVQYAVYKGWVTPNQLSHWNKSQICWVISNCFSNFYSKPANFNPNMAKWNTPGPWSNTTTKTGTKSTPKRKGRKNSPKRTKRYTGMRLVGTTSSRKSNSRSRRYTTRKAA
jgi:hypothetical protein